MGRWNPPEATARSRTWLGRTEKTTKRRAPPSAEQVSGPSGWLWDEVERGGKKEMGQNCSTRPVSISGFFPIPALEKKGERKERKEKKTKEAKVLQNKI